MTYTLGSLFSGIGGLDLAAHWAGFETVWFVEKESFCQKVLNKHWPNVPVYGDVFECHDLPHVDVMCGGFPCQPFSVAGKQEGKNDERYLLPEMLRIVGEVQPYAVLFENVPGFPSLDHVSEFKYLLRTLAEMGFDAEWGHLRASDIGAPHQRERWFLVAYATSDRQREFGGRFKTPQSNAFNCSQVSELVNASSAGCEECNPATVANQPGYIGGRCNELGNTERGGRSGFARRRAGAQLEDGYTQSGRREVEPGIRGASHGLPGWLDFVGFPARPGQQQFAYEPPRTAPGTKETNARIKSLGNAVVPYCAYPLFQGIQIWLSEQEMKRHHE